LNVWYHQSTSGGIPCIVIDSVEESRLGACEVGVCAAIRCPEQVVSVYATIRTGEPLGNLREEAAMRWVPHRDFPDSRATGVCKHNNIGA